MQTYSLQLKTPLNTQTLKKYATQEEVRDYMTQHWQRHNTSEQIATLGADKMTLTVYSNGKTLLRYISQPER